MRIALPELDHSPFTLASDLIDAAGRPLGELHARPAVQVGVDFTLARCPYGGSRAGHWMNRSALRATSRQLKVAVAGLHGWRAALTGDGWLDGEGPPDDLGVWGLAMASLSGAGLLLRAEAVPTEAEATLHKVLLGVAALAWASVVVWAHAPASGPRSVVEWLAFAEQTGMLVHGGSGRACAGAPAHLELVFAALLEGAPDPSPARGPGPDGVAYGRAVRQVELARVVAVLRVPSAAPLDGLVPDWAGHLCGGLEPPICGKVLARLEADPRTRGGALDAVGTDPLRAARRQLRRAVAGLDPVGERPPGGAPRSRR